MTSFVVVGLAAGLDVAFVQARETRDVVVLVIVGLLVLVLATALPAREHRRERSRRPGRHARPGPGGRPRVRRRHPRLLRPARRQGHPLLGSGHRRLHGARAHDARVARPDRAARRPRRDVGRRHGSRRHPRVGRRRAGRQRQLAARVPGRRAAGPLHRRRGHRRLPALHAAGQGR